MFFKEARQKHQANKDIRKIPTARQRSLKLFKGEKSSDRRRAIIWIGGLPALAGLALLAVNLHKGEGEDSDVSRPAIEHSSSASGVCQYPNMTSNPEQIGVLQNFLTEHQYYTGPLDQVYGQQTMDAVVKFQTEAKADGRYNVVIDGMAGYLTCKAMGEPYFIKE